jgi:tetratricopeptide (TPR) repeat protein
MLVANFAAGQVDIGKANDYYSSQRSDALKVVEQYHLGPCQQRLHERDYVRAYGECNFILKIFPNHPSALLMLAQACWQGKVPKCILDDVFQRAVSINPRAPGTLVILGIQLHRQREYPRAIEHFKRALELDPDNLNANYNIALTYLDTKQFALANEHAQRAYGAGATLPGLRNRLQQAGHWKPSPQAPESASPKPVPPGQAPDPAKAAGAK